MSDPTIPLPSDRDAVPPAARDTVPPAARDTVPPEIPDFELIRPIGEGGFGRVWLASNRATGHLRAVKVIPSRAAGAVDPAGREITSITRLEANLRQQHPNLLNIHHVAKTAECLYYVMDPADDASGTAASQHESYRPATLQRRLENGPLSADECLQLAEQLLAGLASLHNSGMVHRDVKPANCLFVDGQLKLADFGLLTEAGPQVSRLGTQKYMPPDGRMDARADVYAAGLVIYEMITALPAESFPRLGERAAEVAGKPILGVLVRLALRACQPDPQQRFHNAREMAAELEACRRQAAANGKRSRRRPLILAVCTAVALVAAGTVYWATRPPRVNVNFITNPFEATIYLDGELLEKEDGTPHKTPCTVDDLAATVYHVEFRLEGYSNRDAGDIDFSEVQQVTADLSP